MGYCTDSRGRLCCDVCGHAGGCRRVPCPAGYCPATVMCEACRKNPDVRARDRAHHVEADCAGSAARFAAEKATVDALKAAGEYVFCASVYVAGVGSDVRCWFRGASGESKELVVSKAVRKSLNRFSTYDAVKAVA